MIRIVHVTFSSSGGAGKFAQRLNKAQLRSGLDSTLITFNKEGLAKSTFDHPILTALATLDFGLVRKDLSQPLFTLFRDKVELFDASRFLDENTTLHLHWTPGVISRKSINKVLKTNNVVWTLHDMFPITGGCHHAIDCTQFEKTCGNCPQVRLGFKRMVNTNFTDLQSSNQIAKSLTMVSPSKWLQESVKHSSIGSGVKVKHIPNPIDSEIFYIDKIQRQFRENFIDSEFVFGFCASDLSDPNKNIDEAMHAINSVANLFSTRRFRIIAIGVNLKNYVTAENITMQEVGKLESDQELAKMYRSMDVFINPSLQENYPTTLLEALGVGTPCLSWRTGGADEIIVENKTGILVSSRAELVSALTEIIQPESLIRFANQAAVNRHRLINIEQCTEMYNDVYRLP